MDCKMKEQNKLLNKFLGGIPTVCYKFMYIVFWDEPDSAVIKTIAGFHVLLLYVQCWTPAPKRATPPTDQIALFFLFIRIIFVVGMHFLVPQTTTCSDMQKKEI